MKQHISNHLKNVAGWRTNRKLIIFSVDDYGNVRVDSKNALSHLKKQGVKGKGRFDAYDTLETRQDLQALFEVLTSVKDKHGHPAKFTPYALPCNINFEAMAENGYSEYVYEKLPQTFEKLNAIHPEAYQGAWDLWQEGISKNLMKPQFHGREHFNLKIFNDLLSRRNENLVKVLKERSYISIPEHEQYSHGWTAAYSFEALEEAQSFLENIKDGIQRFKEVYGYNSKVFTPPAQQFPLHLEEELLTLGLFYSDRPFRLNRHLGNAKYQVERNKLGANKSGVYIVRNVVFEPSDPRISNWVDYSFKQVEAAFFWRKPANISSHRVNFCGHIDENNRKKGLKDLKQLLDKIVTRWPEVEFITADQLGDIITKKAL